MKKTLKSILTILSAVALVVTAVPANADAAAADNTAFLAYADSAWTYQYWGDPVDTGVVATDASIEGAGQYTVALDFTGTADGAASGLAFVAPMIEKGESNFPGFLMQIDSVKVNGEEVALTGETYTSCDNDGKFQMRTNLFNSWVADSAVADAANNPRTLDGTIDGAKAVVVNPDDFASVKTVSVTFTLIDPNAAVEEDTTATDDAAVATDDAAATTTDAAATSVPKTGVVGLGLVYGLGALATGSVVLKRKEK